MSEKSKTRPVFIKATNVEGLVMKDNTISGNADFAHLDQVRDVQASGNVHINSSPTAPSEIKKWYERPLGIVALGLLVAVVAGGILHWLGWV
jgi:hypothetical protein